MVDGIGSSQMPSPTTGAAGPAAAGGVAPVAEARDLRIDDGGGLVTITGDGGDASVPVLALPRKMDADVLMTLLYAIQQKQGRDQIKTSEQRIDDKRAKRQEKHEEIMAKIKKAHEAEHKSKTGALVGKVFGWIGVGLAWAMVGIVAVVSGGAAAVPLAIAATGVDRLHDCPGDRPHGQGHRGDARRRQDRHGDPDRPGGHDAGGHDRRHRRERRRGRRRRRLRRRRCRLRRGGGGRGGCGAGCCRRGNRCRRRGGGLSRSGDGCRQHGGGLSRRGSRRRRRNQQLGRRHRHREPDRPTGARGQSAEVHSHDRPGGVPGRGRLRGDRGGQVLVRWGQPPGPTPRTTGPKWPSIRRSPTRSCAGSES